MENFKAYRFTFSCQALTAVSLPLYSGSVLRGAFFGALRQDFCLNKRLDSCLSCPTAGACPICRLVATVEPESLRGADVPRPFSLQPVLLENPRIESGRFFDFGLTLFGDSLSLFPYAILAVQRMGEIGLGSRMIAPGRFRLDAVRVANPLSGKAAGVFSAETRLVTLPEISITHADVLKYVAGSALSAPCLSLQLLTPLRLVVDGSLVSRLAFRPFLQRLLRRLTDLYHYYCHQEMTLDFPALLQKAASVRVVEDNTRWIDLSSYSNRRQTASPTGGLVGRIIFSGLAPEFLPLLVWGQFTHLGKDATRGNGWYALSPSP